VVETLFPNTILFPCLPDTLGEEELTGILSAELKQIDVPKPGEEMMVELVRSEDYKGATVTFMPPIVAERVKELLKQENSGLLNKLGGNWWSARPLRPSKPRLARLEIGIGLKAATSGRVCYTDHGKAMTYKNWSRSTKPCVKEWRKLSVLPESAERYLFFLDLSLGNDMHSVKSGLFLAGLPQPDWITIYRGQKGDFDGIQSKPSETFPPILQELLRENGIPVLLFTQPKFSEKQLWFSQEFRLDLQADLPIEALERLDNQLRDRIRNFGAGAYHKIVKTFSKRISLPAELVFARKLWLQEELAKFKRKSFYNEFKEKEDIGSTDLIYECTSDDPKHLQYLQGIVTTKVCAPTRSFKVSPNLGETELGHHLIRKLQASKPTFTFQPRNSTVHIWSEGTEEEECFLQIQRLEQSSKDAKEMRIKILPKDANDVLIYLQGVSELEILHFQIQNTELRIWAPPAALEQNLASLHSQFSITEFPHVLTLLPPTDVSNSAETLSCGPCGLCGTQLTAQEFVTLDICAHQFHLECMRRYIAMARGHEPIGCPYRCDLLTYPELAKISKTISHDPISELAIAHYLKSHSDTVIFCPGATCSNILELHCEYGTLVAWCYSCAQIFCLTCAEKQGVASVVHNGQNPCKISDLVVVDAIAKEICPICAHQIHDRNPCSCCPCQGQYTYNEPKPVPSLQPPRTERVKPSPSGTRTPEPSSSNAQPPNTHPSAPSSSNPPPSPPKQTDCVII